MAVPSLPAQGSPSWFTWAQGLHNEVATGRLSDTELRAAFGPVGYVLLDSFDGATDDDKLTTALSYAAAQTQRPAIMFPNRLVTLSQTRQPFSGMKLIGPPVVGWQNPELAGGSYSPTRVRINCGTGTSSWIYGTARTYDVAIRDLQFESTNSATQFAHQPLANDTAFAWNMHNLGFNGFKHVLGTPTDPFTTTLVTTTGDWTVNGVDTQFSILGSDNFFWCRGALNVASNGSGKYVMYLNTGNSSYGNIYVTILGNDRGILCDGGTTQSGNRLAQLTVEGTDSTPAVGALIRVNGGTWFFSGLNLHAAMANPAALTDKTDRGYLHVQSGTVHVSGLYVQNAPSVARTVPAAFVEGGELITRMVATNGWSSRPVVAQTQSGLLLDNDPTVTPKTVTALKATYGTDFYGSGTSTVSVTATVGDLLVAVAMTHWSGGTIATPTGGTGLTWTLRAQSPVTSGYSNVYVWTATATTSETFTLTFNSTSANYEAQVQRWINHGGVGATAAAVGGNPGAPSTSVTTTTADSVLMVAVSDVNAVATSGHAWLTNAGPVTEVLAVQQAGALTAYVGYHADDGATGAKTVGLSAPTTAKGSIVALEIKPS